jgi:hypothetical protein
MLGDELLHIDAAIFAHADVLEPERGRNDESGAERK